MMKKPQLNVYFKKNINLKKKELFFLRDYCCCYLEDCCSNSELDFFKNNFEVIIKKSPTTKHATI